MFSKCDHGVILLKQHIIYEGVVNEISQTNIYGGLFLKLYVTTVIHTLS